MKKIYFLLLLCIITMGIHAQDTLKPFNNRWGTELNINPFNGSFSLNNASGQIKLRKFLPDNKAFRLAFTVNYLQNNSKEENAYGFNPENTQILKRSFMISVNVGKEKHFSGSGRISPYLGYDIGFGVKRSAESNRSTNTFNKVKGAWQEFTYVNSQYYYTNYVERAYWSIGANVVSGLDIYITRDFYLGYEIAFGLDYINYSNIEITQEPQVSQPYPDLDDESWKFGPKLLNGIRIGYVF
jgi:hypothetical protein